MPKKTKSVRAASKHVQNVPKKSAPPPPPPPRHLTGKGATPEPVGTFKPVYVKDHGSTRAAHRQDPEGLPFVLDLPTRPARATHLRWTDGHTTVEVPVGHYGDFSSMKKGHVEWGIVRDGDGAWIPVSEAVGRASHAEARDTPVPTRAGPPPPPPPPGAKSLQNVPSWLKPKVAPAAKPPRTPKPAGTGPKKEGVCAFIDARIMEGGRSVEDILALVMAQFPGRDAAATTSTIKTRPSHIKAKGMTPPAFVK